MGKLIDFSDPCLRTFLPVLLQDHTTGKNIIWATDPPPELGVGFADATVGGSVYTIVVMKVPTQKIA